MADEEIKLLLDVRGAGAIKDLQENLGYTRTTLEQLKTAYAAGEISTEQYLKTGGRLERQAHELASTLAAVDAEQKRLNADLMSALSGYDAVDAAMEEIAQSSNRAAAAMGKIGAASKSSGANIGQAALEGSRALEDLQYGIGGVVNNIPSLIMALGGGAGLTAVISLLAVGINQLVKHWGELMGSFESRNPIPEATTALGRHEDALKKVNKSLDALKEKTSLSNDELAKYNALTREQADLEERIASERQRERDLKELASAKTQDQTERGSAFTDAIAGKYDKVRADLIAAETTMGESDVAHQRRLMEARIERYYLEQHTNDEMIAFAQKEQAQFESYKRTATSGIPQLVDELLQQLKNGEEQGFRKLRALMDGGTGVLIGGNGFRAQLEDSMPEAKRAREAAEKSQALIEEFEDPALADQALANQTKAHTKEQAAAKKAQDAANKTKAAAAKEDAEANRKQIEQQIARENAAIKGGGYDVFAQGLLAQTRAQGGTIDRNGRLHRMTEEQILEYVRNQVERALRGRNRGMDAETAWGISTKVALGAKEGVEQKLTGMGAAQASNQQKLIAIASQNQAELDRLMGVIAHQGQQIDQLKRRAQARSRTPLKRGG